VPAAGSVAGPETRTRLAEPGPPDAVVRLAAGPAIGCQESLPAAEE
jgi:hypothetical protein